MVDSVVLWAREYKVDGFRFDLMGHHSKDNMLAIRDALYEPTLKKDGVDGKAIYLYGEGWNFGEVANNALFEQATQGQLGRTGIGTFTDRLRDAVHGVARSTRARTRPGLRHRPRHRPQRRDQSARRRSVRRSRPPDDLVKLGSRATSATTSSVVGRHGEGGRRARLQRLPRRLRRPARRGHHVRRRARQRDAVRPASPEAARRYADGRPGAHEHAVAGDDDLRADAVVLARRHRAAALQVA